VEILTDVRLANDLKILKVLVQEILDKMNLEGCARKRSEAFMSDFYANYGRFVINGFEITCPTTKETLGWAVYLDISIIDHSCNPNAKVTFNGNKLTLLFNGERLPNRIDLARDLRISYIVLEDFGSRSERRAQLKHQYYFDCFCQRCCEENEGGSAVCENKITDL